MRRTGDGAPARARSVGRGPDERGSRRAGTAPGAGTKWAGKCWIVHSLLKYEFDLEFEIPVTYPQTAIELQLPELDGKTSKRYRGGKICLTVHFKPRWAKVVAGGRKPDSPSLPMLSK